MNKFLARIAIGGGIFVGGLWCIEFVEYPSILAAKWVGIMIVLIAINIPGAEFKQEKTKV